MTSLDPGVFGVFGVLGVFGLFTFSSSSDLNLSARSGQKLLCCSPHPLGLEVQVARAFEDSALGPQSTAAAYLSVVSTD